MYLTGEAHSTEHSKMENKVTDTETQFLVSSHEAPLLRRLTQKNNQPFTLKMIYHSKFFFFQTKEFLGQMI